MSEECLKPRDRVTKRKIIHEEGKFNFTQRATISLILKKIKNTYNTYFYIHDAGRDIPVPVLIDELKDRIEELEEILNGKTKN